MIIILAILLIGFAGLVWLGRQTKKPGYRPRSFIKQGRTISGLSVIIIGLIGIVMILRGLAGPGAGFLAVAMAIMIVLRRNFRLVVNPKVQSDAKELAALKLLGLTPGADREAIEAAWRTRMKRAHPDLGGSPQLAADLNAARDYLLEKLETLNPA